MNLTITKAAKGLEVSRKQLSQVVNETASVSAEMAVRLEQAFGVNAEFGLICKISMVFGKFKIATVLMSPGLVKKIYPHYNLRYFSSQ